MQRKLLGNVAVFLLCFDETKDLRGFRVSLEEEAVIHHHPIRDLPRELLMGFSAENRSGFRAVVLQCVLEGFNVGVGENLEVQCLLRSEDGMFLEELLDGEVLVKELLRDRQMSATDACYAAGFTEYSSFYEAFRRVTGQSPRTWRWTLMSNSSPATSPI